MSEQTSYVPALDNVVFCGLKKICDPKAKPDDLAARPFSAEFKGEPCTVATDGRVMLAVRGARDDIGPYVGKHRDSVRQVLDGALIGEGVWHYDVNFDALCEWMIKPGVLCPSCGGTGKQHENPADKPNRFGALYGYRVDREQLASVLPALMAETVDVFVPAKTNGAFVITSDDWRIMWTPFPGSAAGLDRFPNDAQPATT